jgi:uncharacterized membrane protein YphA (DoxX/SURF4 family)
MRLAIGGLFIWAGVVKIWDFKAWDWATQQFATDVQNYHLTSWDVSILMAVYLPWVELVAGAALLINRLAAGALALLGGMTVIFIAALASAWARGLDISCGCFGKEVIAVNFPLRIGEDLALFAGIAVLAVRQWAVCRAKRESASR